MSETYELKKDIRNGVTSFTKGDRFIIRLNYDDGVSQMARKSDGQKIEVPTRNLKRFFTVTP